MKLLNNIKINTNIFFSIISITIIIISFYRLYLAYTPKKNIWQTRYETVFNNIRQNSVRNIDWTKSDWDKFEEKNLINSNVTDLNSFYKSIKNALLDLKIKNNHSFLIEKNNNPTKKEILDNNPETIKIYIEDEIGIFKIPPIFEPGKVEDFVTSFQNDLNIAKKLVKKGWIIDLTENSGGNIYPMLAALSYFYETEDLGGFLEYNKQKKLLFFDGQKFKSCNPDLNSGNYFGKYKNKFPIKQNKLPVIVLIGSKTASAGEYVALALKRQKLVTLMGQPTSGCASSNGDIQLPDQLGILVLTQGLYLDVNNEPLWEQKINPDIILPEDQNIMLLRAKKFILKNKNKR